MAGYFWNRINGKLINNFPENYFVGQYQVAPEYSTFINNIPSTVFDFIISDNTNESRVIIHKQSVDRNLKYNNKLISDQLTENAVSEISHSFNNLLVKSWEKILELSPLVPKFSERIEIQDFERIIESKLGHLFEVCHRPITLLSSEIEKVHVSRAIRIPQQATEYLLSHTEDWEKRTIQTIQPHNVLSELVIDDYNIYENKVSARLVDHLRSYLFNRILEVKKLYEMIYETNYRIDSFSWANHSFRIFELWGESIESGTVEIAKATLDRLKTMYYKLGGLIDSPLYRKIPTTEKVEPSLMDTNILTSDQHYRQVAKLWREWYKINKIQILTGEELYKKKQETYNGFNHFCLLLITKALEHLKLSPKNKELAINDDVELIGRSTRISLKRVDDQTFEIHLRDFEKEIRFVPIFSNLNNLSTSDDFDNYISIMDQQIEKSHCKTIILFPDQNIVKPDNDRLKKINSLFLKSGKKNNPYGIIPVSPFSLFSVEKAGRAIRQFIDGTIIKSYPPEFDIDNSLIPELIQKNNHWIEKNSKSDGIFIIKPPSNNDIQKLEKYLSSEIHKAQGKGKFFNHRKQILEECKIKLEEIRNCYKCLLACPLCNVRQPENNFNNRYLDNKTFTCSCKNCNVEWGLNSCSNCKSNYPFISLNATISEDQIKVGWVDKIFGMDLIASPCGSKGERMYYRCTNCNYCSVHESINCNTD